MDTFCRELPKIELHAHLNGSLSAETLKLLGALDENVAEYHKLNKIVAKSSRTLDDCFQLFRVAHNATKTKEMLYKATTNVIKEFREDNVIYLELRTTPRCEEFMTKREYIETVVTSIHDSQDDDIIVKLILSIDRRHDNATSELALDLFIEMKNKYPNVVKGIDLSGNPNEGEFNESLFSRARDSGLFSSLHCGEVKNDREVENILIFKPDRIGHATCLHPNYGGDVKIWKLYDEQKIPLEACITSNVICGTATSYSKHHLQEWIKRSLPFSLCTDDKGVFCTSLSEEFRLVHKYFDLNQNDLWNITNNSIDYTFATNEEKLLLKSKLMDWKKVYIIN